MFLDYAMRLTVIALWIAELTIKWVDPHPALEETLYMISFAILLAIWGTWKIPPKGPMVATEKRDEKH